MRQQLYLGFIRYCHTPQLHWPEWLSAIFKGESMNFQDIIFELDKYWAERGCIIQQPY
ncbi:MAG: glycine--tRNA ligase subunit alpha, partial [Desulfofustis sp.]|nr:glycine--tRNA ligase subunit alpha [Desulfofustis sp.]